VKLSVDVDEGVVVSLDRAIPCGLILNELMTNALKHGFSNSQTGEITVILKSHHLAIYLIVENDGNGLPESFELQKIRSMGLRLVNALVNQLHGQFEVEKTAKTRFKVTFDRT
jgi:two-component sensor histidine kinase